MIQSRKIRYFLAAADHLHFSAAAAELHISQPALSRSIRQLEDRLGLPLFERAAKGVILTRYGKLLARRVRQMQLEAEHTLAELEAIKSGSGGTLHVGAGPIWLSEYLPPVIHDIQRQYPDLQVDLMAGIIDTLLPALMHGKIDVFCGDLDFPSHPEVTKIHLVNVDFAVIAHKQHPLARKATVQPRDLQQHPWITMRGHYSMRTRIGAFFASQNLDPPKTGLTVSAGMGSFVYLAEGDYLMLLPRRMLPAAQNADCIELPLAASFGEAAHGIAFRRTKSPEASVTIFVSTMKSRFKGGKVIENSHSAGTSAA